MGLLDEAIRDHLDLKRMRGADPVELVKQEREALGGGEAAPHGHLAPQHPELDDAPTEGDLEAVRDDAPRSGAGVHEEHDAAGDDARDDPELPPAGDSGHVSGAEGHLPAAEDPPTMEVDLGAMPEEPPEPLT
jgi:hypothetical protein